MAAPLGNKNKEGRVRKSILRAFARSAGGVSKGLDIMADKLVQQAQKGDAWAIQLIADRIDGKPHQTIDGTLTHNLVDLTDAENLSARLERSLEQRTRPVKHTVQ